MNGLKRAAVGILGCVMALSVSLGQTEKAFAESTSGADRPAGNSRGIVVGAKDLFYKQLSDSPPPSTVSSSSSPDYVSKDLKDAKNRVISNMGLNFSIMRERNGQLQQVSSQSEFRSGDAIQFKVTANIDGYMYVFLTNGSTGKRAQLYPPPSEAGQNKILKGITYTVPENGQLCFDNNPGVETLQLALSPNQMNADDALKTSRSITITAKDHTKTASTLVAFENVDEAAKQHFAQLGITGSTTAVTTDTSKPFTVDLVLQHTDINGKPAPALTASKPPTGTTRTIAPITNPNISNTLAVGTAAALNSAVQDKWALVVGISKYKDSRLDLKFPHKDAQDFANYLISEGNFAPDHVHVLINEQATKENILDEMGESFLPINAKKGDLVVVYIAGHGSAVEQDVASENFLVVHDTDVNRLYATSINMNDLVHELKKRIQTDRVLLVLDTCHAGSAASKVSGPERAKLPPRFFQPDNPIPIGTGQLVIASSTAAQKSHDSVRYANGIFTKHFIDGLRKFNDIDEVFSYTEKQVSDECKESFTGEWQTPQLKQADWKGAHLVLKAAPVKPRPALREANNNQ